MRILHPVDLTQSNSGDISYTLDYSLLCSRFYFPGGNSSAYLSASGGKPKRQLSWFLFTRGFVLIVFELTILRFGWFFNLSSQTICGASDLGHRIFA